MRTRLIFVLTVMACAASAQGAEKLQDIWGNDLPPKARACLQQVNNRALLRTYHLKYQYPFSTRTSSTHENFSKASSASSTEDSTRSVDPGIVTGALESYTEFSSSKGKCGQYFSQNRSWWKRQVFVAENYPELRRDVARGDGEYLDALQHLSLCQGVSQRDFSSALKAAYRELYQSDDLESFSQQVDAVIRSHPTLAPGCGQLST